MYPPDLVTVRLDLGWAHHRHVGMFAAEAYRSHSKELLALEVHPVQNYDTLNQFLQAAQTWQASVVWDLFDPEAFP